MNQNQRLIIVNVLKKIGNVTYSLQGKEMDLAYLLMANKLIIHLLKYAIIIIMLAKYIYIFLFNKLYLRDIGKLQVIHANMVWIIHY